MFGRNLATSRINSAVVGAKPAFQVGTPTFASHKITGVTYQHYLDTQIADAVDITVAIVASPQASASGDGYVGTGSASGGTGQFVLYNLGGNITIQCINSSNSSTGLVCSTSGETTPLTDFRMISGRISGLVNPTLKVDEYKGGAHTKGNSATGSATRVVATTTPKTLAIGSKFSSLTGAIDVAALLIWHRMLSDAELLAAYLEVEATLDTFGITC